MSGNRRGQAGDGPGAGQWADQVETRLSVVSCIAACDVVHTMTSLSGFDALLRGKRVVVHGQPFYAGWGLTEDRVRGRRVRPGSPRAAADNSTNWWRGPCCAIPIYWDWDLQGYTTCEAVLRRLLETRDALAASGELEKLRVGLIRRQWRKLVVLLRAWATPGLRL
jgi:capsular polysaccharide export protein